jgi:phage terminase small subunit
LRNEEFPLKNPEPTTPTGLSDAASTWWQSLHAEYSICDPGGLLLLEAAMRAFDRAEEARALIDAEGLTVKDRFGQAKPHPSLVAERDARSQLLQALKALNLDVEPLADRPGRPAGGRL